MQTYPNVHRLCNKVSSDSLNLVGPRENEGDVACTSYTAVVVVFVADISTGAWITASP